MPDFRYPIRNVVVERELDDGTTQAGIEQYRQPIGTGKSEDKTPDAKVHRESHSEMEKADK